MNGRSGNAVIVDGGSARKTVTGNWEPTFMWEHPDVFVQVIGVSEFQGPTGPVEYSMVECVPADHTEIRDALPKAASLLKRLWDQPWAAHNPRWQAPLAQRLKVICATEGVQLRDKDVDWLVREADHHQLHTGRLIHGDATLANLVYDGRLPFERWRWIDPLTRPFVPGDPLVDLGKMYQSCLGYERVLAGLEPERDDDLIEGLAHQTNLCEFHGLVWATVHIIRLIPYQHTKDKPIFAEMLHNLFEELRDEDRHAERPLAYATR